MDLFVIFSKPPFLPLDTESDLQNFTENDVFCCRPLPGPLCPTPVPIKPLQLDIYCHPSYDTGISPLTFDDLSMKIFCASQVYRMAEKNRRDFGNSALNAAAQREEARIEVFCSCMKCKIKDVRENFEKLFHLEKGEPVAAAILRMRSVMDQAFVRTYVLDKGRISPLAKKALKDEKESEDTAKLIASIADRCSALADQRTSRADSMPIFFFSPALEKKDVYKSLDIFLEKCLNEALKEIYFDDYTVVDNYIPDGSSSLHSLRAKAKNIYCGLVEKEFPHLSTVSRLRLVACAWRSVLAEDLLSESFPRKEHDAELWNAALQRYVRDVVNPATKAEAHSSIENVRASLPPLPRQLNPSFLHGVEADFEEKKTSSKDTWIKKIPSTSFLFEYRERLLEEYVAERAPEKEPHAYIRKAILLLYMKDKKAVRKLTGSCAGKFIGVDKNSVLKEYWALLGRCRSERDSKSILRGLYIKFLNSDLASNVFRAILVSRAACKLFLTSREAFDEYFNKTFGKPSDPKKADREATKKKYALKNKIYKIIEKIPALKNKVYEVLKQRSEIFLDSKSAAGIRHSGDIFFDNGIAQVRETLLRTTCSTLKTILDIEEQSAFKKFLNHGLDADTLITAYHSHILEFAWPVTENFYTDERGKFRIFQIKTVGNSVLREHEYKVLNDFLSPLGRAGNSLLEPLSPASFSRLLSEKDIHAYNINLMELLYKVRHSIVVDINTIQSDAPDRRVSNLEKIIREIELHPDGSYLDQIDRYLIMLIKSNIANMHSDAARSIPGTFDNVRKTIRTQINTRARKENNGQVNVAFLQDEGKWFGFQHAMHFDDGPYEKSFIRTIGVNDVDVIQGLSIRDFYHADGKLNHPTIWVCIEKILEICQDEHKKRTNHQELISIKFDHFIEWLCQNGLIEVASTDRYINDTNNVKAKSPADEETSSGTEAEAPPQDEGSNAEQAPLQSDDDDDDSEEYTLESASYQDPSDHESNPLIEKLKKLIMEEFSPEELSSIVDKDEGSSSLMIRLKELTEDVFDKSFTKNEFNGLLPILLPVIESSINDL